MAAHLTIIIPMHNASQHISGTIESILAQEKCEPHVIFIDAESSDGTLESIESYKNPHFYIQSVPFGTSFFEMVNVGLKMAGKEENGYIQILLPGDSYLFVEACATLINELEVRDLPDLLCTASCTARDKLWLQPLSKKTLLQGDLPTVLQAILMKKSLAQKIGMFDVHYKNEALFDFLVRAVELQGFTCGSEMRLFVDLQKRGDPRSKRELFWCMGRHFGYFKALMQMLGQSARAK